MQDISKGKINKTQQKRTVRREQVNPGPRLLLIRTRHSPADDTTILTHYYYYTKTRLKQTRLWRGNACMWSTRFPLMSPIVDGVV